MPVTATDVRAVAAPLPRTEVAFVRDAMKFRVRGIVYAAVAPDELTMGFAYPKDGRAGLVAGEPHKFHLPIASDMRFHWVRAWLDQLEPDEMRELVVDAWTMVVPKKVVAEYLAGADRGTPVSRARPGRSDGDSASRPARP